MTDRLQKIIDRAIEYGVKTMGCKNAMAISLAGIWLDGYIAGYGFSPKVVEWLRAEIANYKFND